MKRRPRINYTEQQRALMWERWQKGGSLEKIAQLFDRHHPPVERILRETGGIRPAPRHRSKLALTVAEREEISRAVVAGHSIRSIPSWLQPGHAPSTISREITRNGRRECYRANKEFSSSCATLLRMGCELSQRAYRKEETTSHLRRTTKNRSHRKREKGKN